MADNLRPIADCAHGAPQMARTLAACLTNGAASGALCIAIREYLESSNRIGIDGRELIEALVASCAQKEPESRLSAIEALRMGSLRAHVDLGDYLLALKAAQVALLLEPPTHLSIRVKKMLGLHLFELGSLDQALEQTLEALDLAEKEEDDEQVAGLLNNIGLFFFTDSQSLAEEFWRRARDRATTLVGDAALAARTNLARLALDKGDYRAAIAAAEEAVDLAKSSTHIPEAVRRYSEVMSRSFVVRARLPSEDPENVLPYAQSICKLAGNEGPAGAAASIAMALVNARRSPDSGAPEDLLALLENARKRGRPAELADLLSLVAEHYELIGHSEEALRYLRELSNLRQETKRAALSLATRLHLDAIATDDGQLLGRRASLEGELSARATARLQMAVNAARACGYDEAHPFRKARLAQLVGEALGWDAQAVLDASSAAALCDIGMIAVPNEICRKTRALSEGQLAIVREHVEFGARLLCESRLRSLEDAIQAARSHHAHWDGRGYPALAGDQIPIIGRIVALCCTFESLTHDRPWRKALPINAALMDIERASGTQFDPELTTLFTRVVRETFWRVRDWEAYLREGVEETPFYRARRLLEVGSSP
jgi:HD-GYP domain-containing protein (c-di-GMP phosphodiesterase class II)